MRLTYRPLPAIWPSGARTVAYLRRPPRFKADWRGTLALLERELNQLDADSAVLEAGFQEGDIRIDGLPRANARPSDPAVVLNFESKFGPLRYGCDTFTSYEANLRAIALALEALRLVDRYGVTKRGEQYAGWKALPDITPSRIEAERFILAYGDGLKHRDLKAAYREAAKKLHPDVGGSRAEWDKLQRAKEAVGI